MAKTKVKIEDIKVGNRVRDDYGDIEELAVSIQRYGLFHPILVDKDMKLVAGERRLKAHVVLGLEEIEVRPFEDVDELTKREIEIEENIKRKDFNWQEEVKAKKEVDTIKRKLYGSSVKGHGGGWSLDDTAKSLGESTGTTSQDIKLAKAIEEFPELSKEKNKSTAWKRYLRLKERALTGHLARIVKDVDVDKCLVLGNSAKEMKKLKDGFADLLFTDPPFAIGLDDGKMSEAWGGKDGIYKDDKYDVMDDLEKVIKESYRVLKNDRHIYVFFGIQHYFKVREMLEEVGFNVNPVPIVWNKVSGGIGGSPFSYSNAYIVGFFGMKGRRELAKSGQSNVFTIPRVPPQKKHHPAQMPGSFVRKLIEQSSLPGEMVIDPYAGSGEVLVSALETGRRCWGCEMGKDHYNKALVYVRDVMKGNE